MSHFTFSNVYKSCQKIADPQAHNSSLCSGEVDNVCFAIIIKMLKKQPVTSGNTLHDRDWMQ